MILIDSCGWIEYFIDGPLADRYARYVEEADEDNSVTPTIVVYEVYKKIKNVRGEREALEAFTQINRTKIIDLTRILGLKAADISLESGLGMTNSIAVATARAHGAEIVTSDEHLEGLPEAIFINI